MNANFFGKKKSMKIRNEEKNYDAFQEVYNYEGIPNDLSLPEFGSGLWVLVHQKSDLHEHSSTI